MKTTNLTYALALALAVVLAGSLCLEDYAATADLSNKQSASLREFGNELYELKTGDIVDLTSGTYHVNRPHSPDLFFGDNRLQLEGPGPGSNPALTTISVHPGRLKDVRTLWLQQPKVIREGDDGHERLLTWLLMG